MGFEVYPSPQISKCVIEPYNTLLSTHGLIEHTDMSVVLDNKAIYWICQRDLEIKAPTYNQLNRVMNKTIAAITYTFRFQDNYLDLNVNMQELQSNTVSFPRLHFLMASMAPILRRRRHSPTMQCQEISELCFSRQYFQTKLRYRYNDILELENICSLTIHLESEFLISIMIRISIWQYHCIIDMV